jgi:hypothetical protein
MKTKLSTIITAGFLALVSTNNQTKAQNCNAPRELSYSNVAKELNKKEIRESRRYQILDSLINNPPFIDRSSSYELTADIKRVPEIENPNIDSLIFIKNNEYFIVMYKIKNKEIIKRIQIYAPFSTDKTMPQLIDIGDSKEKVYSALDKPNLDCPDCMSYFSPTPSKKGIGGELHFTLKNNKISSIKIERYLPQDKVEEKKYAKK